mgnify:CR=1 FL=1
MSRNTASLTNSIDIVANSIHLLDENNNGRNIFDLFIDASDVKIPIPKINPNDETTRYDYIESDVNNDNVVNIFDFGILSGTFGLSSGQVGYDSKADLDGNLSINIFDFGLLSGNFGQTGKTQND